ncbi:MAG: Rossmann-like and DUF2520 domain-containing protein [Actinomycetota bacterium]
MNIALYGTGRAAGALGIALSRSGHQIVSVVGRSPEAERATSALFDVTPGPVGLRVIAVKDDAIEAVAHQIADLDEPAPAVHVSGAVSVAALDPIAATGSQVGSFHPLQTMPDPVNGARRLPGAWIGITAPPPLYGELTALAESIGCRPFPVADESKHLYHAAAAASANFVIAALAIAEGLFERSGVPFEAAIPLVDAVVENSFALGPRSALTGPIARSDVGTVSKQLEAVRLGSPELYDQFVSLARITAETAGTADRFEDLLR